MKFAPLSALFSFAAIVPTVFSTPVQRDRYHALERRDRPSFVKSIYMDNDVEGGLPPLSQINGFNVVILSFLLTSGAADQLQVWTSLTSDQRNKLKSQYNAAGVKVIVSAFGDSQQPTTMGVDPIATANQMSDFVIKYNLDGIDVDYEDFDAMNAKNGKAETWLINFTKQLRQRLPSPNYIITHAPVAPWFNTQNFTSGGYNRVNKEVGDSIDWYHVQFYNQGKTEYTDCEGLLNKSSQTWPNTAVFQLNSVQGVDLSKIVIGKPATAADTNNGFMSTSTLATCLKQAVDRGFNGGVMVFEFPEADSKWIAEVMSQVGSDPQPPKGPTTTTTTTTSTSTSTSTLPNSAPTETGFCSGIPAWNSEDTYAQGAQVTFFGHLFTATESNQAESPRGGSGAWIDIRPC